MADTYQKTFALLSTILKRLDSRDEDIDSLLPLFDGDTWLSIPRECPSCDELFALAHHMGDCVFCSMRGHGLKSNYINLLFTSQQLIIAASMPFGNLQEEDMPSETENLHCVIASLVLVFSILRSKKDAFLQDDKAILCLRCQDYETMFQIREGNAITQEGDSWKPLIDLAERTLNQFDTPDASRLYI